VGQDIAVTARLGASASVRVFELNRSLTGMANERYDPRIGVTGDGPADVLARRLFDLGAMGVTVYSNVVTVQAPPDRWGELEAKVAEAIEHLFRYYGDEAGWSPEALRAIGVEPAPTPEPAA
jgi:hypothetical protein